MPHVIASVVSSARFKCVALSIILSLQTTPVPARDEQIKRAADYCQKYQDSIKLSEDGTILCFDGPIRPDRHMNEELQRLNNRGFFVIRSPGGLFPMAMEIADVLLEKNATVIIHDYCLSVCANYIFVATKKTHILKNAVAAWHGGPWNTYCDKNLRGELGEPGDNSVCKTFALHATFFQKRGIDPGFIYNPPTSYTKMMFWILKNPGSNSRTLTPGQTSKTFWMWNPGSHQEALKSRIVYESYPRSQYEVDEIINKFHPGTQIIFDPEL
jgi:hypothetical protein